MADHDLRIYHPDEYLPTREDFAMLRRVNSRIADFIAEHILASLIMFDLAVILPLICLLPGMHVLYDITLVLSGNWIQLWALPALQRSSNKITAHQDAMAAADHQNLRQMLEILQRIEALQSGQTPR